MKYTEDWFSSNIPVWEVALKDLKGKKLHIIELGSYEGRASVWLRQNIMTHPEATMTCVDTWKGSVEHDKKDMAAVYERFLLNIEEAEKMDVKVSIFEGTTVEFFQGNPEQKADLIYIDASHNAADVFVDAALSHLALNPGGILIFDDYLWSGLAHYPTTPKGAIDAFTECFSEQYEVVSQGYQMILRKKWVE